jgi:hypothetical protein
VIDELHKAYPASLMQPACIVVIFYRQEYEYEPFFKHKAYPVSCRLRALSLRPALLTVIMVARVKLPMPRPRVVDTRRSGFGLHRRKKGNGERLPASASDWRGDQNQ